MKRNNNVVSTLRTGFIAACCFATTGVMAQAAKASIGVKGGATLTNLYVDDVSDENAKVGFTGGLFFKVPVSEFFSIQPEVLYSQKGSQIQYDNLFAKGTAKFNLHYVEVPVMAVINLGPAFNIHAGPYVGYLAGVGVTNKKAGSTDNNFEKDIDKDNFQKIDYGLAGGVGFNADKLGIGLRYNYGLREIGKDQQVLGATYNYFPNAKNAGLSLYVTVGL